MNEAAKAVFLDRDGVINLERGDYTYRLEDFVILPKVKEALAYLKSIDFLLIVVTNQAGISKGLYTREELKALHGQMADLLDHQIDAVYYCPYHPSFTNSLSRKPATLMFERAASKFNLTLSDSWMVGDRERDMIPARKLGVTTIAVGDERNEFESDFKAPDLWEASSIIARESNQVLK